MSRFVKEAAAALGLGELNNPALAELELRLAQLVPFVGAGLSVPYGYPGWGRFLQELAPLCEKPEEINALLQTQRFEEAAEAAHQALGKKMDDAIRRRFGREPLTRPVLRGAMAWLPRITGGLVLTTNFDPALESVYEDAGLAFNHTYSGYQIEDVTESIPMNPHVLLKLHGDFRNQMYRILTNDQYQDAYGVAAGRIDMTQRLPAVLLQAMGARPLLFLGCSLTVDRTTDMLQESAQRYPGSRHFALLSGGEDSPERRAQLKGWNVLPLYFTSGEFDRIERFLECLATHVRLAPQSPPTARPRRPGFFGRADKVDDLLNLISKGERLITITGAPGCGKTRFASEAASLAAPHFRDGVLSCALDSLVDATQVLPHVVDALRSLAPAATSVEEDASNLPAVARRLMHMRRLVLLLDNFEHVRDAAPDVEVLLKASPDLVVIVTSREPLNLRDEQRFPLEPLSLPQVDPLSCELPTWKDEPALQLFEYQRRKMNPGFVLDASNVEAVLNLCQDSDGLPLAIELTARRAPELPVQELLRRQQQRSRWTPGSKGSPDSYHRAMDEAIASSYERLTSEHQALFRRVSIFSGSFDATAAARICFDEPSTDIEAEDELDALADRKLLEVEVSGGALRYRMLVPLQAFAAEELLQTEERPALLARFVAYWSDAVRNQQLTPGVMLHDAGVRRWLGERAPQLRAAIDAAIELDDAHRGLTIAVALRSWWLSGVHVGEGRQRLDTLLALPPPEPPGSIDLSGLNAALESTQPDHLSAWQRWCARLASWIRRTARGPEPVQAEEHEQTISADAHNTAGDDEPAWPWYEMPLRHEARTLAAMLAQIQGDADSAAQHLEEVFQTVRNEFDSRLLEDAVAVAFALPAAQRAVLRLDDLFDELQQRHRAFGNWAGLGGILMLRATLAVRSGDADEAVACITRCEALPGHATRPQARLACALTRGDIAMLRNEPLQALDHFRVAEQIVGELGDQAAVARSLISLRMSLVQDPVEGARTGRTSAERALSEARLLNMPMLIAKASTRLAGLLMIGSDWPEAEVHIERSIAIFERVGATPSLAGALQQKAVLLAKAYRDLTGFPRAIAAFKSIGDGSAVAQCYMLWGEGAIDMTMHDEAMRAFLEAQRLYKTAGNQVGEANATLRIANAHRERKEFEKAETQYRAAIEGYNAARADGGVSNTWRQLGDMQRQRRLFDDALKSLELALEAARKAKDANAEAGCQIALGDLHVDMRR
jgi:predicted ATPase/tetratricopeptide (TPR) repeat protein